jgi:hypothetical protein
MKKIATNLSRSTKSRVLLTNENGDGRLGLPFLGSRDLGNQKVIRTEATSDERMHAENFRNLLRELSADFNAACKNVGGQNPSEACSITDTEIDALIEPILREHGYDLAEIAVMREKASFVERSQKIKPTVFSVDLTQPYNEMRKLQIALELIVRSELLFRCDAYCVPVMQDSDKAAVFVQMHTWEKTVSDSQLERLTIPMHRLYKGLTDVTGPAPEFRDCRVVHFVPFDHARSNVVPQLENCASRDVSPDSHGPVVVVEGETVIAAFPHETGIHVASATLAVEAGGQGGQRDRKVLPDMSAIIAHVEGVAAVRAEHLS